MFRLVTVIGLIGIAHVATAEPVRMTGDDIKRVMVPGAVLEIDTPLHIGIPVKVAPGGIVSAEAGALGLTLGALKDRGRYWTDGDKLCMKWFRWFDAKARCMTLLREGNKVYWSEGSGENGTATITEASPVVVAVAPSPPKKPKRVETAAVADPLLPAVDEHCLTGCCRDAGGVRHRSGIAICCRSTRQGSAGFGPQRSHAFRPRHERAGGERRNTCTGV